MVKMSLKDLTPELTEEEFRELQGTELKAPAYDEESPEMSMEQLQEFKRLNHENRTKQTVSLRLSPERLLFPLWTPANTAGSGSFPRKP